MFTLTTQCIRDVLDPPVSLFSLSLYRHPFQYTLCISRFTLIINNINDRGKTSVPEKNNSHIIYTMWRFCFPHDTGSCFFFDRNFDLLPGDSSRPITCSVDDNWQHRSIFTLSTSSSARTRNRYSIRVDLFPTLWRCHSTGPFFCFFSFLFFVRIRGRLTCIYR